VAAWAPGSPWDVQARPLAAFSGSALPARTSRYRRRVLTRFRDGLAATLVTLFAVALVALDLTKPGFRSWWRRAQ
jgi:hypothetical protein